MVTDPSTVERAFELARTGSFKSVDEIRKKLKVEGFDRINAHLRGSLSKQLLAAIRAAASDSRE